MRSATRFGWRDKIVAALQSLGGEADGLDIAREVLRAHGAPATNKGAVRTIFKCLSDGGPFVRVRHGRYSLVNNIATTTTTTTVQKVVNEVQAAVAAGTLTESRVAEMIAKAIDTARVDRITEIKRLDGSTKVVGRTHKMFKHLLFNARIGVHTYLYGPPGSGKSHAAHQVADALGREFGYISLTVQTSESKLFGNPTLDGGYAETVFIRCYEQGGIFCIDEMDNAAANLLTSLNGALENGRLALPHRMVTRHPEFVVVAGGNTTMRGGDTAFPDRRAQDAATISRFAYIKWGYDEELERTLALDINPKATPWVDWIQKVRAFAMTADPKLIVDPRATYRLATFTAHGKDNPYSAREMVDALLFRAIEPARIARVLDAHPIPRA